VRAVKKICTCPRTTTDYITAEGQQFNEVLLPHIMRHIMIGVQHVCGDWLSDMTAVGCCVVRSGSAVEYVVRHTDFLRDVVSKLCCIIDSNSLSKDSYSTATEVYCNKAAINSDIQDGVELHNSAGSEGICMNNTMWLMIVCVAGSLPNKEQWESIMDKPNIQRLLRYAGPDIKNALSAKIYNFFYYLKWLHGVNVEITPIMRKAWQTYFPADVGEGYTREIKESRSARLQDRMENVFAGADYTVYCSNPGCEKVDRDDDGFKRCSRSKLCRYYSKECQVNHWKKGGHKKQCDSDPI